MLNCDFYIVSKMFIEIFMNWIIATQKTLNGKGKEKDESYVSMFNWCQNFQGQ